MLSRLERRQHVAICIGSDALCHAEDEDKAVEAE